MGQDIAGFMFASLMITIAAGGGIGGGGVLVPTYIFILGFEPKYAIPLSNCTILGSSISNLILNVNKRHDYADRPRIDWDIMLMISVIGRTHLIKRYYEKDECGYEYLPQDVV